MKKVIIAIVIVLGLLVGGFYALNAYIYNEKQADAPPAGSDQNPTPSGPDQNQEPTGPDAQWVTFTDTATGISFQYPDRIEAEYAFAEEWPPSVSVSDAIYSCAVPERIVGDRAYCVRADNEGAAGSVYTSYSYTYSDEPNSRSLILEFVLRYPQCGNYSEPQAGDCQRERESFDPDTLADAIMRTVTVE